MRLWLQKNYLVSNSCLFRPPWGAAKVESSKQLGASLGAQQGPAGAASARPPARSGGVEARAAQPALQRELSAALGSLCSQPQQRRLRHSVKTETSGGDARTGSDHPVAEKDRRAAR